MTHRCTLMSISSTPTARGLPSETASLPSLPAAAVTCAGCRLPSACTFQLPGCQLHGGSVRPCCSVTIGLHRRNAPEQRPCYNLLRPVCDAQIDRRITMHTRGTSQGTPGNLPGRHSWQYCTINFKLVLLDQTHLPPTAGEPAVAGRLKTRLSCFRP